MKHGMFNYFGPLMVELPLAFPKTPKMEPDQVLSAERIMLLTEAYTMHTLTSFVEQRIFSTLKINILLVALSAGIQMKYRLKRLVL
ncbi:hypothetical protein J1N35_002941 [Gossypium stocksii]|uniref:Uncharacterized protein n=1 Tax=Gossypium stocksii TaxID=47602 RepID=A0A9D3WNS1_9ROSI|nr:hypothetical protein J1N35_002941 [Gossypium stocksii]